MQAYERLIRYARIYTTSDENAEITPSTARQFDLSNMLAEEMNAMGFQAVTVDEHAYTYGVVPASEGCEDRPSVGLIAHLDTAPDFSGEGVKPQLVPDYDGKDLPIGDRVLSPEQFPDLKNLIGHTLITTDGNTLLGADDKAGCAEIMTAAEYLMAHPEIKHGKIRIGFTPDEEIGRGVDYFDVATFGADFAYTMDGSAEGELEYENFNAASAVVEIQGRNVHPGYAKNKMINAIQVACELNELIPAVERPEHTEAYDGFYHCVGFNGTVENAKIAYIIRDHSSEKFEQKKVYMWSAVDLLQKRYGEGVLKLTLKDQYFNMRKMVEPHPHVIEKAMEAMRMADVEPKIKPIRGGTDGARLSFMGLPCPNIFAGGMNFHGKFEYCSLNTMQKATQVIVNLAELWAK